MFPKFPQIDKKGMISFADPNFFGKDFTDKYAVFKERRLNELGGFAENQLRNIYPNVVKIVGLEADHKSELERLAVKTAKDLFPVINEIGFKIKAEIAYEISHNDLSPRGTPEVPRKIQDASPEMYNKAAKQKFLNALSQGAGVNMNSIHHMVKDKMDKINPNLVETYDFLMKANEYAYFVGEDFDKYAILSNREGMIGGTNNVTFEKGIPVINAKAVNFVNLVHEIIKGVYTYLALNGYESEDEYYEVTDYTDSIASEIEDIRCGKMMIDVLRNYLLDNFDKYYEHPCFFEMYVVALSKLPADEFVPLMKGLVQNNPNKTKFEQIAKNCYYDLKDFDKKKYKD